MKKIFMTFIFSFFAVIIVQAQGYSVGDVAEDFNLKNVDGKLISLYNYEDASKGAVVIFTCNHCPYAIAYEDRIIEIDKEFRKKGFPVIAINPNDPVLQPKDSYDEMVVRANEKQFVFPYLFDKEQKVYKMYGAKRTPHVYLLKKVEEKFVVSYIGTIDNNYKDESAVSEKYLANAINALMNGNEPEPNFTKAVGCSIKDKNYKK